LIRNPKILSFFVLLALAVATFVAGYEIEKVNEQTRRDIQTNDSQRAANEISIRLSAQVRESIFILSGLKALIEGNPNLKQSEFEHYARSVRRLGPGIRSIAAAPDMVVTYVHPIKGNEAAIGLDYRKAPVEQRAAAFRTLRVGQPIVAGPVRLVQGGVAFIVRLPVFVRDANGGTKDWGILAAPIDTDVFFQQSGLFEFTDEFELAIRGHDGLGEQGRVFYGDASLFTERAQPVRETIGLGSGNWVLAVTPKGGWVTQAPDQMIIRIAMILTFLVLSITWLTIFGYLKERNAARIRRQQILKEKSEFLEILSHEIRSPLQGVLGAQQYILDNGFKESMRPIVETAHESGNYILSLINDYLDLQRAESGNLSVTLTPVNIRKVIDDAFRIATAGKKNSSLSIKFSIAEEVPARLMLDQRKVNQVLVNIIDNAIKYTARGYANISAAYHEADEGPVLKIHVEDTGVGINKEDLETLFDRFTRSSTGENRSGSGLGLAISKSLVEAMGGTITVRSEVAKGTDFSISLPAFVPTETEIAKFDTLEEEEAHASAPGNGDHLSEMRVLIADDVVVNRLLLNAMLSTLVKDVILAEDGQQVLNILEKEHVDVIIMDAMMPNVSGIAATMKIRQQAQFDHIPIIGLTGEESMKSQAELLRAGMDVVLLKPIDLAPILSAIKEQMAQREKFALHQKP
jgi:signal transduction histidine kinase/CheY-like chemotaxis protein